MCLLLYGQVVQWGITALRIYQESLMLHSNILTFVCFYTDRLSTWLGNGKFRSYEYDNPIKSMWGFSMNLLLRRILYRIFVNIFAISLLIVVFSNITPLNILLAYHALYLITLSCYLIILFKYIFSDLVQIRMLIQRLFFVWQ